MFFAHISEERVQPLKEHIQNTAQYAKQNLEKIGLGECGYLCGLTHDMGKYKAEYQEYLQKAARGEKVVRGSVNHTFCGVIYMLENFHNRTDPYERLCCELIAYAIGAHHGLFDCYDTEHTRDFISEYSAVTLPVTPLRCAAFSSM